MNTVTPHSSTRSALVLMASPRSNGFTAKLLKNLTDALGNDILYTVVSISKTDIAPCIDCRACFDGPCPFNDDGFGKLMEQVDKADLLIVATPVYFNHVPAKFKAIFDRLQQLYVKKIILKTPVFTQRKAGILISVAGSTDPFATQSMYASFDLFFKSFNAEFLSHIAITNTDKLEDAIIPQEMLSETLTVVSNYFNSTN